MQQPTSYLFVGGPRSGKVVELSGASSVEADGALYHVQTVPGAAMRILLHDSYLHDEIGALLALQLAIHHFENPDDTVDYPGDSVSLSKLLHGSVRRKQ